jgi:hypothetical protein
MTYNLLFLPEVEEDVIAGYMTNTHHATMEELVIGKNLSWMDGFPAVHEPEVEYIVKKRRKAVSMRRADAVRPAGKLNRYPARSDLVSEVIF